MWSENCNLYILGSCIPVNIQPITFRNFPLKPGQNRIKICAMCKTDISYIWKIQMYKGKNQVKGKEKSCSRFSKINCITCENFFRS